MTHNDTCTTSSDLSTSTIELAPHAGLLSRVHPVSNAWTVKSQQAKDEQKRSNF